MFTTKMFAVTTGNFGPSEKEENGKRKKSTNHSFTADVQTKKSRCEKTDEPMCVVEPTDANKINPGKNKGLLPTSTYEDVLSHMLYSVKQENGTEMDIG